MDQNWVIIIQSAVSFATVFIAYKALNIWKEQHKAQIIITFLDQFIEILHQYINVITPAINKYEYISNYIDCFADTKSRDRYQSIVCFIKKYGKEESDLLQKLLTDCFQVISKLNSLAVKGSVYDMQGYQKIITECANLDRIYGFLHKIMSALDSINCDWDNDNTKRIYVELFAHDHKELTDQMNKSQIVINDFIKTIYGKHYEKNTTWSAISDFYKSIKNKLGI